jgi:hypothetical protein
MRLHGDAAQITGDHVLIARETARVLGMGTDIRTPEGLPQMTEDGRMPPNLGRDYAHVILPADGFAQVRSPLRPLLSCCDWAARHLALLHVNCLKS